MYHALYPSTPKFGSVAIFDPSKIPEARTAIPIVTYWLRNFFYALNAVDLLGSTFVTFMVEMTRIAFLFDKGAAEQYVKRVNTPIPSPLLRNNGTRYVMYDLSDMLQGLLRFKATFGVLFIK